MQQDLSIETLGDLSNGYVRECINQNIRTAILDTEDRGSDGKKRKVVITLTLEKIDDSHVGIDVQSKCMLPSHKPKETVALLKMNGGVPRLVFQDGDASNPSQNTLS